jgi:hypothetical protein
MLRNVVENKMYSKSKNMVLNKIEYVYNNFTNQKDLKSSPELRNISFNKESWFNIMDINLMKSDTELVLKNLKTILSEIVNILKEVKGKNLCFKYFSDENIYAYLFNNMKLLKDLNLDTFLLENFLLL